MLSFFKKLINPFSFKSSIETKRSLSENDLYSMLFEDSPLPQAIVSLFGVHREVNEAYCALNEIAKEGLIGKTSTQVGYTTEQDLLLVFKAFENEHHRLNGYLAKYHTGKGKLIYVKIFAHRIVWKGEASVLIVEHDVTQQRLAEKAVKESERLLNTVLNCIPTRVFWKDRNSIFRGANQNVLNDGGFSTLSEFIGKSDFDLFDIEMARQYIRDDQDIITNGTRKLFFEEQLPLPNGSMRWMLTSKVPLKDNAGKIIGLVGSYDDITIRKKAEFDLKFARFSIDHVSNSIIWIKENARIVNLNPAFSTLLQYTESELLSFSIPDIDVLFTFEKWALHWENLRDEKVLKFFTKQRRKDGTILDVEVRAHFLEFEGEEYNCAFIQDVTEQKKLEEKLLLAHQFQDIVLNTIPSGVFWKDRESKYLGGNAMFRTTANFYSDISGKQDEDFPWAEQANALRADDRNVMENNTPKLYYVEQLRNADGKFHYNEVSKVPLTNMQGEVVGVLGTFRDITEQKEVELALKENEKLLKGVVQNAAAIIYIIDKEGIFKLSEGLGLATLGLKPGQVVGVSVYAMYADFPEIIETIRKGLSGNEIENEIQVGTVTFSNHYTPLRDDKGEISGILCVSFDITERKKLEQELSNLNSELEQRVALRTEQLVQANQDLEAFAYSVSHDLRAPIRHIDGFSKLMYSAILNPSEIITRHYQRIIDSSKRMSHMVDDLLSFARLGKKPISKGTVNIDVLLKTVVHHLAFDIHPSKVELEIKPIGTMQGDSNLLQLAFENLLSNALKYSASREVIKIKIGSTIINNELEIYFEDNGVGFDMHYADKLFGVFQRLHSHEEFEGTGIGLANVRQIVLKHGGSIRAEGKVGEGATIYLKFPLILP